MKIEKITPCLVDRFLLVRVYTDEGLIGNLAREILAEK